MSSTERQGGLLINQDWKTIYQSFRNANFQSYDFDTLKRTMVNYIRENYPEDFNDYIESSEYIALIDLIAYLGQSLSFRGDLAARENFLATAERRESILRLASLISYNPKRNQSATGLMRFETIRTTERVIDSNGNNLANVVVSWNDKGNDNYFEQFTKILDAAMPSGSGFGDPVIYDTISGTVTEQYRMNTLNTRPPVYPFSGNIQGLPSDFEAVSTVIGDGALVEEAPLPGNLLSFVYRNDGQGPSSSNTGFFLMSKQGTLRNSSVNISSPVKNQVISVDTPNINDKDVWLYSTDTNGVETALWNKIEAVKGMNAIYNSEFGESGNIYSVSTRADDRVSLVFSDGTYGNTPRGNFRVYYRTSANRDVTITPGAISNVSVNIPYLSKANTRETLTITMTLRTVVSNSFASETNEQIKERAPSSYYTQSRMITGEDYNIGLLNSGQDVLKVRAVNRISSGISRYYELSDPSGTSSSTSLYGSDGVLFKEDYDRFQTFTFETRSDIEGIVYNTLEPILQTSGIRNFYLTKFGRVSVDLTAVWEKNTEATNLSTGRLINDGEPLALNLGELVYVTQGAMCKFIAPVIGGVQYYFTQSGELTIDSSQKNIKTYIWAKVANVTGDGTELQTDGSGAISLSEVIPSGAILTDIIPLFSTRISTELKSQIIDSAFSYNDFGLRYDPLTTKWDIIIEQDLNTIDDFSMSNSGDISGQNLDSSWIMFFKAKDASYELTYRNTRFVFESENEIRFTADDKPLKYDFVTGKVSKDKIEVLSVNTAPDAGVPLEQNYQWSIVAPYNDEFGYVNNKLVEIDFFDNDYDGSVDNPDAFNDIVSEDVNIERKFVFKEISTVNGRQVETTVPLDSGVIIPVSTEGSIGALSQYNDGQVFYIINTGLFKTLDLEEETLTIASTYRAFVGRQSLKFYYRHNATSQRRIDPASSNIIDAYILSRSYDNQVRRYVNGSTSIVPLPPTADELYRTYNPLIRQNRSISDEVIYHPVSYKFLFGSRAKEDLQATFRVIKNPNISISDTQLRTSVISAINRFFAVEYWNFGDTFYFQELSAYVMNQLSPNIVSFVMVPKQKTQYFGNLFEIKSNQNEIFVSVATASDVEIIEEHTQINTRLR